MAKYKLYYFDARGRAEATRLMFAAADVKFDDVRLTREEYEAFKPQTPFGVLPVLEVEGQKFGESMAIHRYVARELGFHGKTNLESLAIDQVMQVVYEFVEKGVVAYMQPEPEKKAEMMKVYTEETVPKYFGHFEKLLQASKTDYFVGETMTVADIVVFDFVGEIELLTPGCKDNFPKLKAMCDKVRNVPRIKTHIDNRKETPF